MATIIAKKMFAHASQKYIKVTSLLFSRVITVIHSYCLHIT